jgi:dihydroorotate dehydrogenase electron transfer subunit
MMQIENAVILEQKTVTGDYNVLVLDAPEIADSVKPGQFVHIKVPRLEGHVLRRPFSVYGAEDGMLSILYKRVGKGTSALALLQTGEKMSIMGPLGNGFPIENTDHPVLVAGGFGVAPLFLLAKKLKSKGDIFIGGRTADDILCVDDFTGFGWNVHIATEDGSRGETGRVTDILCPWLKETSVTPVYYACGPDGMLKAIGDLAQENGSKAWLSLDKHMGCGVGACLACVQKIRRPDGSEEWGRVCQDGPIFEAGEIVW